MLETDSPFTALPVSSPDALVSGKTLTPAGFVTGTVEMADGRISRIHRHALENDSQRHAPDQLVILPGFVDLHNHGGAGESFPTSDEEGCSTAAHYHAANGTTTLLASTVSLPADTLLRQLDILAGLAECGLIAGIHAEGPFINACRCGAQDPRAILDGDPDLLGKMIRAARGHLRAVTLAPETARVRELIEMCAHHGVVVSFGHTNASFEVTMGAIAFAVGCGARVTATHLMNAMPPLHHREPGAAAALVNAALDGDAVVELIADGVHLSDHTVAMLFRILGAKSITLVSDAMAAAGMEDGAYDLGALPVQVCDGIARLRKSDGALGSIAGGTSRIIDQVRRHVANGLSLEQVVAAATSGHRVLGLKTGIDVGNPADLVVCTAELDIKEVWKQGQIVTQPTQ